MIKEITKLLIEATLKVGISNAKIELVHPEDMNHGDFSCNVAMVYAKQLKMSPKALAEKIVEYCNGKDIGDIKSIEIAGPGFINFKIKDSYFSNEILRIGNDIESIGKIDIDKGKEIMVEYTDPNPFKVFHIGHLMANTIGESISRIVEASGAKVIRACYQGDVGLHVAKTVWGVINLIKAQDSRPDKSELTERINFLGRAYVFGNMNYESQNSNKLEIEEINKAVYEKRNTDKFPDIQSHYKWGLVCSLEYFDEIYKKLGTKFNNFFFESEVADDGINIVKEFLKKGTFEESDGAVVFPGERYGEHTRVFINSQGLPTYEAKELGLNKKKFSLYPKLSESIIVTANEQDAYFRVVLKALKEIDKNIGEKTKHISHGLLRPASGKMSSRKGNVIPAEVLIKDFEVLVDEKTKDRDFTAKEKEIINNQIAIAGLKYTILRQSIGGDIIYDPNKALSFEGDSGPYLQYAAVRAQAVVNKAQDKKVEKLPDTVSSFEKTLIRFPEMLERARLEYAPHHIVTYLTELSSSFNSYYANNQIIDEKDELSPYRILLTKVFVQIMTKGLWVLGIKVPERM